MKQVILANNLEREEGGDLPHICRQAGPPRQMYTYVHFIKWACRVSVFGGEIDII